MKRHLPLRPRVCAAAWLLLMVWHAGAKADIIGDWNDQALEAVKAGSEISPQSARDLAILNTAIYNAVNGISGSYATYSSGSYTGPSVSAPGGASMEAAAAAAANTILTGLYGSNAGFTNLYTNQLSGIADSQAKSDGISFGISVANDILAWRGTDGASNANSSGYTPTGTPGHWDVSPPTYAAAAIPAWGTVTPFAIAGTAGYTGSLPGVSNAAYMATAQYAADYNQVKNLGSVSSVTRSIDQLNAAYFWAAGAGTITTAGLWNKVAQTVAASAGMNLQDQARLFAAMNVAMADSGIVAWQTKFDVDFWSPVMAIVNGSTDGNGATDEDALWQALLDTPNYPGYLSEHSALSAAAARVLASILGDNFAFSLGSDINGDGVDDMLRNFNSFSQAAQEAGMSQIYGGVGFGTSNTDGLAAGDAVGQYVVDNLFGPAPVPEPAGGALLVVLGIGLILQRRRPCR